MGGPSVEKVTIFHGFENLEKNIEGTSNLLGDLETRLLALLPEVSEGNATPQATPSDPAFSPAMRRLVDIHTRITSINARIAKLLELLQV